MVRFALQGASAVTRSRWSLQYCCSSFQVRSFSTELKVSSERPWQVADR